MKKINSFGINIPENVIQSAQISADAFEVPFFVVVKKEHHFYGVGGQFLTARKGNEYRAWNGHPTEPILAILP